MFNFHTHNVDDIPCILNVRLDGGVAQDAACSTPQKSGVALSVGLHPWDVASDWQERVEKVRFMAASDRVWTIGECGLDKVRGGAFSQQMEAFRAQVALAEELEKPMVIHCVKAFDELLALRRELLEQHRREGRGVQPWVVHGFRGKPEQAKQLMAKGLLLSFGHHYHVETLRFVFTTSCPFYLETDDSPFSVRQIYGQVARHLDVDVVRLETLCDPRQTLFRHAIS